MASHGTVVKRYYKKANNTGPEPNKVRPDIDSFVMTVEERAKSRAPGVVVNSETTLNEGIVAMVIGCLFTFPNVRKQIAS